MEIGQFLIMRNELLLTLAAVAVLIFDLANRDVHRNRVIPFAMIVFGIVSLVGFLPGTTGSLFGGSFVSNDLTVLMKNILNMAALIIFLQSDGWLRKEDNAGKTAEYFVLTLATLIGMNFMISAGDFLIFYVGLETATIPLAGLAAYERYKSRSAEAGIKLIFSSALSSGILLFGLSMIYGTTGSIYFIDISRTFTESSLSILGLIFFISGMGFKISLVPFHFWTADVYEGAPINITSYLSVVSKGAALFIFAIILFTVFRTVIDLWQNVIYALAVITMTVANLFALRQDNIKRFLAFSSIAQAGFILLGVISGDGFGMTTIVYFMLIYVFTNLGAFGVVTAVSNASGVETISGYNGMYQTNPKLSLLLTLSLFSLAGIPPVAGFFGKFFLFTAAASQGYYILVLIAVLNATISLYYYLRLVKAMFIDKNDQPVPRFQTPWVLRISLILCLAGIVIIGFASGIYEYIREISTILFH